MENIGKIDIKDATFLNSKAKFGGGIAIYF